MLPKANGGLPRVRLIRTRTRLRILFLTKHVMGCDRFNCAVLIPETDDATRGPWLWVPSSAGVLATAVSVGEIDHIPSPRNQFCLLTEVAYSYSYHTWVNMTGERGTRRKQQILRTPWSTTSRDTEHANLPHQLSSSRNPRDPNMGPYRSSA